MPNLDEKQIDEQFEELWNSVEPMWKFGDKRDAKFFWLKGRQRELDIQNAELDKRLEAARAIR